MSPDKKPSTADPASMTDLRVFQKSLIVVLAVAGGLFADEGMWLLNHLPTGGLRQRYGFEPTPAWIEHLQKSCVRIGASGSFVSRDGLLLTNHHVGAEQLFKLSTSEHDYLANGFYARSRGEELKCPDLEVRVLWSIQDVTDRIGAAASAEMSPADRYTAQRKAMTRVEQESKDATGLESEVITLYYGARYHLYRYKSYKDVRLVMAPEKQVAFFGGDTDNFEYPRFDVDCCFFRVYEKGEPMHPEHYLRWSRTGAREGDLMFVLGHPGRTRRLLTVDHLRFLRDVDMPKSLEHLWRREVQLMTFCNRGPENARIGQRGLFGVQNTRKALTGGLAGLLDPGLFHRKADEESKLRTSARPNGHPATQSRDPWVDVAGAEKTYREFYLRYRVLGGTFYSDLLEIARDLVRLADELPKPSPDRLREYRDSELESLYLQLYSPAPIYDAMEVDTLVSALSLAAERFGADDPAVRMVLGGLSPARRAEQLVHGCTLKDVETRKRYVKEGRKAIASSTDPMIQLARALDPEARALRKRFEDEVEGVERAAYAHIGTARFAAYGESVYPDATGTLRLAFGPVKGYVEDGRNVPAFTTYAGMYERWQERHGQLGFELPQRWIDARNRLNPAVPLNFSLAADIIGGNSGSPVVDTKGELTGLIFDGNLQSLAWGIAYDDVQGRAVAVDTRAIIEALRKVCDAGRLADELLSE